MIFHYVSCVAVALPSKRGRLSVKTAHIKLRMDVFEGFASNFNLTAHTVF